MAKKSPVHIRLQKNGWAVIREGNARATSVHATQAEAAKEGRAIARRDETEFLLHTTDGRIRERREYGEDPRSTEEGPAAQANETAEEEGASSTAGQDRGPHGGQEDGERAAPEAGQRRRETQKREIRSKKAQTRSGAPDKREESGEYREHQPGREGLARPEDYTEDELRVLRSEEELEIAAREREAGAVRVRKRVRTDRQRVRVPKKREEVTVERVPIGRESAEQEIGEGEVVIPLIEEELVVRKRAVVKEEVRVRKEVVEEEELVEEDLRKEEVEILDEPTRHHGERPEGR